MTKRRSKEVTAFIIASIILVVTLSLFLFILVTKDSPDDCTDSPGNYSQIMLGEERGVTINVWFHDTAKLNSLKDKNMKYLFVDVGDTGQNGKLKTPTEDIESFLDFIHNYERNNNVDFIILPYSETILDDYDFSADFQKNYIESYTNLVKQGFDGVHVDIEAIPTDKQEEYLNLLDALKRNIGEEEILTVYAGAISDSPNKWEWTADFFKEVGNRVDIIATQGYDFELDTKEEYQTHMKNQMEQISDLDMNCKLFLTVPTHNKSPETIGNALKVYQEETTNRKTRFEGAVVFAEWTTSDTEWKIYDSYMK